MRKLACSLALFAAVAIGAPAAHAATSPYLDARNADGQVHDRYAATIHCGYAVVTSVMRDDEDAIDGVLDRMADLFGDNWESACPNPAVDVVYIP